MSETKFLVMWDDFVRGGQGDGFPEQGIELVGSLKEASKMRHLRNVRIFQVEMKELSMSDVTIALALDAAKQL